MEQREQHNALAEIFKDEDFDSADNNMSPREEDLDNALSEIAELKKTIAMQDSDYVDKGEFYSKTRADEFTRTEQHREDVQTKSESSLDMDGVLYELRDIKHKLTSNGEPQREEVGRSRLDDVEDIRKELESVEETLYQLKLSVENSQSKDGGMAVMRQVLGLKTLIGSDNDAEVQLNLDLDSLYKDCERAEAYISSDVSIEKKLSAISMLIEKAEMIKGGDVSLAIDKINEFYDKICDRPLEKTDFGAVWSYIEQYGRYDYMLVDKKEVDAYLDSLAKIKSKELEEYVEAMPKLLARKNKIQDDKNKEAVERGYSEMMCLLSAVYGNNPENASVSRMRIYSIGSQISAINLSDVCKLQYTREIEEEHEDGIGKTLFEYIAEIRRVLVSGYKAENTEDLNAELAMLRRKVSEMSVNDGSAKSATLNEVVAQLDRLFDDIKNVNDTMSAEIQDNLSIINDNINVLKDVMENSNSGVARGEDIAYIKSKLDALTSYEHRPQITERPRFRSESPTFTGGTDLLEAIREMQAHTDALVSEISDDVFFIKNVIKEQREAIRSSVEAVNTLNAQIEALKIQNENKEQENKQLKEEILAIKNEIDEKMKPIDSVDSVRASVKSITGELKEINSAIAVVQPEDDLDLDDILGKIDDAIASKK